jgi:hypothetical protein
MLRHDIARVRQRLSQQARRAPSATMAAVATVVGAAALLAASAPAAMASPAATATASRTYWVAPTSTSTTNTGCASAAYNTVQSAVMAAESYESTHARVVPTIELCPGTYTEQVTISSSLVLTRAKVAASKGPVVIQLPASVGSSQTTGLSATNCQADDATTSTQLPQSVIEICSAATGGVNIKGVSVSISHVTVQGNWPTSVCYDSLYGVLVEGGASLSLADSIVEQIGAYPLNGCQGGIGVEAGFSPTRQVGHVTLTSDTIQSYQKNGITVDGPGSTAKISSVTVSGAGPTPSIAQNGIQISLGATAMVVGSTVTGNNYTGNGDAYSAGILVFGGGGRVCGIGKNSPLVKGASVTHSTLINNDVAVALFNVNNGCDKSVHTPTRDVVCHNSISNSHGYAGGVASADANVSGLVTTKFGPIGDQAGVSDSGDRDVICDNSIRGAGYASRDKTSTLPNPRRPAWVRPVDLFSYAPAYRPHVYGNTYDGKAYKPR